MSAHHSAQVGQNSVTLPASQTASEKLRAERCRQTDSRARHAGKRSLRVKGALGYMDGTGDS